MTPTEAADILRQFNDHRRGCDVPSPKPSQIGRALDAALDMIERMEKIEVALEAILNSGLLSGQYTIHDKMTELARAALEKSK